MDTRRTLFALELIAKEDRATADEPASQDKWRARDGITAASCADPKGNGVLREAYPWGEGRAYR